MAKRQANLAKHWPYFDRLSASNIELSESACSYSNRAFVARYPR